MGHVKKADTFMPTLTLLIRPTSNGVSPKKLRDRYLDLRSGHSLLTEHMFRLKINPDEYNHCDCGLAVQTPHHGIMEFHSLTLDLKHLLATLILYI